MTRLSGTTRFMFFAFVTIAVIAILQTSTPISESSIDRRAEIWWQSNTETSTQSQDSREFILSNEPCPNDIPLLEPKQVDVVDLELSLVLDLPGAIALAFLDAENGCSGAWQNIDFQKIERRKKHSMVITVFFKFQKL